VEAALTCIYADDYDVPEQFEDKPQMFTTQVYLFGDYLQSPCIKQTVLKKLRHGTDDFDSNIESEDFIEAAQFTFKKISEQRFERLHNYFKKRAVDIALHQTSCTIEEANSTVAFEICKNVPVLMEFVLEELLSLVDSGSIGISTRFLGCERRDGTFRVSTSLLTTEASP